VDEATHMKFSMFLKQKSDIKEKFIPFLKELRDTYGRRVHQFDVTMQERIEHLKMRVLTRNWVFYLNIQHTGHLNKMV